MFSKDWNVEKGIDSIRFYLSLGLTHCSMVEYVWVLQGVSSTLTQLRTFFHSPKKQYPLAGLLSSGMGLLNLWMISLEPIAVSSTTVSETFLVTVRDRLITFRMNSIKVMMKDKCGRILRYKKKKMASKTKICRYDILLT